MKNLKVWTFHPTARNSMAFVLLSLVFLLLQRSLQSNLPFMNVVFLKRTFFDEWIILLLSLPALWMLWKHKLEARFAFALFCSAIAFRSLEGLFLNFDKILMIVLFVYVCMAYAFYQLIGWTFTRAVFSPNYREDDLQLPMALQIPVRLKLGDQLCTGYLTNWDNGGAFIYLHETVTPMRVAGELTVKIEDHAFQAKGSVVTVAMDGKGIGLEWENNTVELESSWMSLMALFNDLGWEPRLLR